MQHLVSIWMVARFLPALLPQWLRPPPVLLLVVVAAPLGGGRASCTARANVNHVKFNCNCNMYFFCSRILISMSIPRPGMLSDEQR